MVSLSTNRKVDSTFGYEWVCSRILLPLGSRVTGSRVASRYREISQLQWKPLEELRSYRRTLLQRVLNVAVKSVPYYESQARNLGLSEDGIDTFAESDLPNLPILTKQVIRENFEDLKVRDFRGRYSEMKSSGSTGQQTVVLADGACFDETYATQLLFWSWGGFSVGRRHLQTGMSLQRGLLKRTKDILFRCSYTSAFDLTDEKLAAITQRIESKKIRCLFGYASSLYVIADYYRRMGINWRMNCIFSWGDMLFRHYRQVIEEVMHCRVNDCYGLGEGLQCAAQCEQHGPLHEAMHGVMVEIVDHDGMPCKEGELGRVLVTRLESGPMPLIRYDTGDVASFVPNECPCGRQLRTLSPIQGRCTDIVTTPGGDRLIVHFFTQIFEMIPEIAQFQVRQTEPSGITILYVPARGFHPGILSGIQNEIQQNCRHSLKIEFQSVGEIPLEKSNKRRFVISTIPFGMTA
jgi:phenylacetate-CoA ligase